MTNITEELNQLAGDGLIAARTGASLAVLLEELPGMADTLGTSLGQLSDWLAETFRDKELAAHIASAADSARAVHDAADRANAIFQPSAAFWLAEGIPGASHAGDIAEAMAPGFIPEDGGELEDTIEGLAEFSRYLEESVISIGSWYDEERGENDGPVAQLIEEMGKLLGNARDELDRAEILFSTRYEFWTRAY